MSMNLNAAVKNETIQLWQTPTQISYTILPREVREAKGVKAREALIRYMEWVHYSTNGVWPNRESLDEATQRSKDHIAYIEKFLNDKTLRVWVM